jgi:hypothetical protein
VKSTFVTVSSVTTTFFRTTGPKPLAVTVTSYEPGASETNEYRPESVLTVVSVDPVAPFLAAIEAPGTIAPLASETSPFRPPRPPWPNAETPAHTVMIKTKRRRNNAGVPALLYVMANSSKPTFVLPPASWPEQALRMRCHIESIEY